MEAVFVMVQSSSYTVGALRPLLKPLEFMELGLHAEQAHLGLPGRLHAGGLEVDGWPSLAAYKRGPGRELRDFSMIEVSRTAHSDERLGFLRGSLLRTRCKQLFLFNLLRIIFSDVSGVTLLRYQREAVPGPSGLRRVPGCHHAT